MAKAAVSGVDNGKALEYCFAISYYNYLFDAGLNVVLQADDAAFLVAESSFSRISEAQRQAFMTAAESTIVDMIRLEPGLTNQKDVLDTLIISIVPDSAGIEGDVRDVIFTRKSWQIGFSVKNNHDAVKHSRLSRRINFGEGWLKHSCSERYFTDILVVFDKIEAILTADKLTPWSTAFANKYLDVYIPLLNAFKDELLRLAATYPDVPEQLLSYLIGRNSFYKMIKSDRYNLVIVKGYNMNNDLGLTYNKIRSVCNIPQISFPERIIEFIQPEGDMTSLYMTLDNGWQIKFRIHSASSKLENSLKFDINLIGNPPIIFTHHIF